MSGIRVQFLGGGVGSFRRNTGAAAQNEFRYWRFWPIDLIDTTTAQYPWLAAELELRGTVGGADLVANGSALPVTVVNTSAASPPVTALFDNNGATNGGGSTTIQRAYGHAVIVDFGTATAVREIALLAPSTQGNSMPVAFSVSGSNDLANWSCFGIWSGLAAWSAGETRTFTLETTPIAATRANARAWRIYCTGTDQGSLLSINQLIFASTTGGATIVGGGSPFQDRAQLNANRKEKMFDAITTTWWEAALPSHGGYCWTSAVNPVEMRVQARNTNQTQSPGAFSIEWSHDGATWVTATTPSYQSGWAALETRSFSIPPP